MRRERGSVLLLVPAAVLVLVVLGSIAVDASVVFLGQRELAGAVAAAANDAAGAAFAEAPFYDSGQVELDLPRARDVAAASLAARAPRGIEITGPPEVFVSGNQLCVRATGVVRKVLAPAVPGASRQTVVHAQSTATLVRGAAPIPQATGC